MYDSELEEVPSEEIQIVEDTEQLRMMVQIVPQFFTGFVLINLCQTMSLGAIELVPLVTSLPSHISKVAINIQKGSLRLPKLQLARILQSRSGIAQ